MKRIQRRFYPFKILRLQLLVWITLFSFEYVQSAVDTLKSIYPFAEIDSFLNIHSMELVENGICYLREIGSDGPGSKNRIFILDLNAKGKHMLVRSIPRDTVGKAGLDIPIFRLRKIGGLLFFNDGRTLKIYDVSNLKDIYLKHHIRTEKIIRDFTIFNDTLVLSHGFKEGMSIYHYNYRDSSALLFVLEHPKQWGGYPIKAIKNNIVIYLRSGLHFLPIPIHPDKIFKFNGRANWLPNSPALVHGNHYYRCVQNEENGIGYLLQYKISHLNRTISEVPPVPADYPKYIRGYRGLINIFGTKNPETTSEILFFKTNPLRQIAHWPGGGKFQIDPFNSNLYYFDAIRIRVLDLSRWARVPSGKKPLSKPLDNTILPARVQVEILWNSDEIEGDLVVLEYHDQRWHVISRTWNDGSYHWALPDIPDKPIIIRIRDGYNYILDSIRVKSSQPFITVLYPNGGEKFEGNQSVEIKWEASEIIKKVRIEYASGIDTWKTIVQGAANNGSFVWKTPNINLNPVFVRVSSPNGGVGDMSDGMFSIYKSSTAVGQYAPRSFAVSGQGVVVNKLSGGMKIRIISVMGRVVKDVRTDQAVFYWNGLADNGEKAAPGIYILKSGEKSYKFVLQH